MNLEQLRDSIPEYARDIRLNLGSVLTPQGAPGLSASQIAAVALAAAIAARNSQLTAAIEAWATEQVDEAMLNASRAAASIMGMNNVYYRFLHLVDDAEYGRMPARLRMNVIGNPGIERVDFELLSLAVSAVNGCGTCVASHERQVREGGLGRESVQSAVRIASVVHAAAVVLDHVHTQADRMSRAA
jgi:alkyl hydroperoxide reductase subunit D